MEVRARRRREAFLQRESGVSRWAKGAAAPTLLPTYNPSDMTPGSSHRDSWVAGERATSRWCGFLLLLFCVRLFWQRLKSGRTRWELSWNRKFSARVYEDAFAAVVVCKSANPKLCPDRLDESEILKLDGPCRVLSFFMVSLDQDNTAPYYTEEQLQ